MVSVFLSVTTNFSQHQHEQAALRSMLSAGEAITEIRWMWIFSNLTLPFVADGSSQLLLTLRSFPEAVGVKVDTRSTGVLGRPAAEHGVAVISPAVVGPFLKVKIHMLPKFQIQIK